jgi:hypothetical protein
LQKAIVCGMVNFLFVSLADGAVLLIPVMVFYWFLAALVTRNPFSNRKIESTISSA